VEAPSRIAPGWVRDDSDHLAVALATASGGWPVFPCGDNKQPATRRGFYDATLDPARITAWWSKHPGHLVGTPTEGLVVVDLDEHDPANEGVSWRWWRETATARGWSPLETPKVSTPSGGLHVYFAAPEGRSVRNSAGKLAPGVDVRGDGGYVIAPGSRLPDRREYVLLEPSLSSCPTRPSGCST
jgi:hypothetical protein